MRQKLRHIWAFVLVASLALVASPWFAILAHAGDGGSGP